jgi:hypothetical protein
MHDPWGGWRCLGFQAGLAADGDELRQRLPQTPCCALLRGCLWRQLRHMPLRLALPGPFL